MNSPFAFKVFEDHKVKFSTVEEGHYDAKKQRWIGIDYSISAATSTTTRYNCTTTVIAYAPAKRDCNEKTDPFGDA